MKKIFLFIMIFGLPIILTIADETTPLVVWTDGGDVSVWQNGETTFIPIGDAIFPYLSPNGEQIALVRGEFSYPEKLSVVSLNGENLRDINLSYPRQVIWQSETVLWVNNFAPSEGALDLPYGTILYRINLENGDITSWDMGEPFMMTINPARDWLALSFAGVYGADEGHISLLSLTEQNPQPQETLRFPAISNGSHSGYFPFITWITDKIIRTTIAEPNAIYILGDILPKTTLWEIATDGTSTELGEIATPLYPVPQWSADGEWLTYLTSSRSGDGLAIANYQGNIQWVIESDEFFITETASFFAIPQADDFSYLENMYLEHTSTFMRYGATMDTLSHWLTLEDAVVADMMLYPLGCVLVLLYEDEIRIVYVYWDNPVIYDIVVYDFPEYRGFDVQWD